MKLTAFRRAVLMRLLDGPKTLAEAHRGKRINIMPKLILADLAFCTAPNVSGEALYAISDLGRAAIYGEKRMIMPNDTYCIDGKAGEPIIDLSYAVKRVQTELPGWGWKVGTCCVSDDAWVAPDYNCPTHGARLLAELGPIVGGTIFDCGVDVDRRPPGNVGQALINALEIALAEIEAAARTETAQLQPHELKPAVNEK